MNLLSLLLLLSFNDPLLFRKLSLLGTSAKMSELPFFFRSSDVYILSGRLGTVGLSIFFLKLDYDGRNDLFHVSLLGDFEIPDGLSDVIQ